VNIVSSVVRLLDVVYMSSGSKCLLLRDVRYILSKAVLMGTFD
jgi:hypothetical protein